MQLPSALVVVLLAHILCVQAMSPCPKDQLSAEIESVDPNSFQVKFKITNNPNKPVCVLKWNTMMDEQFWTAAAEMWESKPSTRGKALNTLDDSTDWYTEGMPYSRPIIPIRQGIASTDYEHYAAGESKEFTRNLGDIFSFKDKLHYWVQIETKAFDCYIVESPADNACPARDADHMTKLDYNIPEDASKSEYFTAAATHKAPEQSFEQWLSTQDPNKYVRKSALDGTPVVAFGTSSEEQVNALLQAHDKARQYISEAVLFLKDDYAAKDLFETWFDGYNLEVDHEEYENHYKLVREHFIETEEGSKYPYVYDILPSNLCKNTWVAHVEMCGKRQHIIPVCPKFFDLGDEDRIVTIIHEMTHDNAATTDECTDSIEIYDEERSKELALDDPDKAVWNADNYALFALHVHKEMASAPAHKDKSRKRKQENQGEKKKGEKKRSRTKPGKEAKGKQNKGKEKDPTVQLLNKVIHRLRRMRALSRLIMLIQ